jgi:hypothetical protein
LLNPSNKKGAHQKGGSSTKKAVLVDGEGERMVKGKGWRRLDVPTKNRRLQSAGDI